MTHPPSALAPRTRLPAKEGLPPAAGLRPLREGERVAHWVKSHLPQLDAWNKEGWRWVQIAKAIAAHIDRPVTRNKLTGMVTMIRNGKLARDIKTETESIPAVSPSSDSTGQAG